jgi:hypothetical protein
MVRLQLPETSSIVAPDLIYFVSTKGMTFGPRFALVEPVRPNVEGSAMFG